MNKNYTHINVILDRSGSMEEIRNDTIGGFNAFLKSQKEQPGKATMTLVQFDTQDPYQVLHRFKPIAQVAKLTRQTYVPRACTPLLDAIGRGINDLTKKLNKLAQHNRPNKVLFVVLTDGQENSSREFTKTNIEKMIKEKTRQNNWQFVFLSSDLAAIDDAIDTGFSRDATLLFEKSGKGSRKAWRALACCMNEYRHIPNAANKKSFSFTNPSDLYDQTQEQNKATFEQYLIDEGYKVETPDGKPSTVYDYLKRIDKISKHYGLEIYSENNIAELQKIRDELDKGGINEALGNTSNRAIYNAMARYCEFIANR